MTGEISPCVLSHHLRRPLIEPLSPSQEEKGPHKQQKGQPAKDSGLSSHLPHPRLIEVRQKPEGRGLLRVARLQKEPLSFRCHLCPGKGSGNDRRLHPLPEEAGADPALPLE